MNRTSLFYVMFKPLLKKATPFIATLIASAFIGQAVQTPPQTTTQPTPPIEASAYPTQVPNTPNPTYTPIPTSTPYPTATAYPTAKAAPQLMETQDVSGFGGTNSTSNSSGGYTCNCAKTCASMSCQEAYFQLNQCGCSARDGDGDGVPCEAQCR